MSSSRVQAPPVNLKERIAALQQRTGSNASAAQRSVSPTPQPTSHQGAAPTSASALREKIARFEKKGGVPVPRGSFGLGAPPPVDGHPRRQNELYGNRLPRVVSGPGPQQRAPSPLGFGAGPGPSSTGVGGEPAADKRRSFSLSNVNVTPDYFDHDLNTPLTSPSLSSPPESPLHVDSIPRSVATPPPSSFATALEFARTVEQATLQDSSNIVIEEPEITEEGDEPVVPPAIVVSIEEGDVVEAPELSSIEDDQPQERAVHDDIADAEAVHVPEPSAVDQGDDTADEQVNQVAEPPSVHQADDMSPQDEFSHPISDPASTNVPTIDDVEDSPQQSIQSSPSDSTIALSPSLIPSPVPSAHKVLLRAAGLGSPSTEDSVPTPSIGEVVFSDDEGAIISPVMAISSPPPNLTSVSEHQISSVPSFTQVLQEPEPEPEPVIRKEPPPALSLDSTIFTRSPSVEREDHPSSDVAVSGEEPGVAEDVLDVKKEDTEAEELEEVEVGPSIEQAGVEAVEVGIETVEAVEAPQVPSSPTTPNVPQLSLPPTQQPVPSRPPASSLLSPPSNLGANTGSLIRPASMIELSPTSSTGFDIPDRKINFDDDDDVREQADHGSVTILPQRPHSVGDASAQSSFKAVVHHKIREVAPVLNQGPVVPQTPQFRRAVSATAPMSRTGASSSNTFVVPPSPGTTDLADLLQSTVLLEQTLEQGGLPNESSVPVIITDGDDDETHETVIKRADGVEIRRLSREEAEENKRTLAKLQAKREEQAKSKIRSTFRNTLARAKGVVAPASMYVDGDREKFGSTATLTTAAPSLEIEQQPYGKRFKSPSVPYLLDSVREDGLGGQLRPKTPESLIEQGKPASLTSKSPKSRFPSFRRLASKSSSSSHSGHGHGHARNSVSTSSEISSSEDSVPTAVTPPDGASEFGEGGRGGVAAGLVWPSVSPSRKGQKEGKEGSGIARAATFAGKMWQRARTKSGTSVLSVHSSSSRMSSSEPPALPPLPNIVLPLDGSEDMDILRQPPPRTTSLKSGSSQQSSPSLPPLPPKTPDLSFSLSFDLDASRSSTPQPSRTDSLSPDSPSSPYPSHLRRRPDNAPPAVQPIRRGSWVSVSSTGSNFNSSLLDAELFDAFPSVPENHPLVLPNNNSSYSPTSSTSLSSSTAPNSAPFLPSPVRDRGQGMVQSFDAALLSSAAHLNGDGSASAGFLAPNSAASGSSAGSEFLPLVSPYSPPESVGTVGGGVYVNGMNGVPPTR